MGKKKAIPPRSKVKLQDSWDLSSLYESERSWEKALRRWEKEIDRYVKFRGTLTQSAKSLGRCLGFFSHMNRISERLGTYAFLRTSEDVANGGCQRMLGQYRHVASRATEASSFIRPEIMAIPAARMKRMFLAKELVPYHLKLERIRRYKPHTLGKKEEKLLAMQSEIIQAPGHIFGQLHDADLKFGHVRDERGRSLELTNATFITFLNSPRRSVRKRAFHKYYAVYQEHENSLAATLNASIQCDVYQARSRGYDSSLTAALFADNVPVAVYENLIESVHNHLPTLYRYYDLRRRKMKLRTIHHYDTYVPILSDLNTRRTWGQAVALVLRSLKPLGDEYVSVLKQGLGNRWCDPFPNHGKKSGAFSCGSYDGKPYILMNYAEDGLDHVFTLAHEAGHSMHSYLSAQHQPFEYYDYSIFVAEVASTLNEQLLSQHLMAQARSNKERAYLINREIDAIRGTIVRQAMFAEFERNTHDLASRGEPLTVDSFKSTYRRLLEEYFGPDFVCDGELDLECFRIPHFYRAFYVYKYATGLCAAIALAQGLRNGGDTLLAAYLRFLKSGCSKFPLDLLRDAGVDMEGRQPVDTALNYFDTLVDELDRLL